MMAKESTLMKVYPAKSGIYQLWFRHPETGKRIKVSTGKRNVVDATNFMLAFDIDRYLRLHYKGAIKVTKAPIKVQPVATTKEGDVSPRSTLREWTNHDVMHYGSEKTASYFKSALASFFKHVDPNIRLDELITEEIEKWRRALIDSKQISGHNYWVIVKASFNRAKKRFGIENVFDRLDAVPKLKKGRKSLRGYAWKKEEIEIILSESRKLYMSDNLDDIESYLFPVIKIGLNTGMRTNEILHMRWRDVMWDEGKVKIENDPSWHSTKTYQERQIKMPAELREFLIWHRDRQEATFRQHNGYLNPHLLDRMNKEFPDIEDAVEKINAFNNRYYKKYGNLYVALSTKSEIVVPYRGQVIIESTISHAFRRFLDRIDGISEERKKNIFLYSTRHTRGTQLADKGATSIQIRNILGHASISTSELYMETQDEAPIFGV